MLTGGQTGVDTAAALAALSAGLPVHLVFPRGYRQEDGPITPSRRLALRGATSHELESGDFRDRTWTCVYLADVVILIDPAGGDGCQETVRAASRNKGQVIMIAGCRASLLASQGKTRDPPGQLAAVMSAVASVRAERLG